VSTKLQSFWAQCCLRKELKHYWNKKKQEKKIGAQNSAETTKYIEMLFDLQLRFYFASSSL
jgi:hypothetical protein